MKTNILNILGVFALVVTLAIIGFGVWYFFSGAPPAAGFMDSPGGFGNYRDTGSQEFTGDVRELQVDAISGSIEVVSWDEPFLRLEYEKWAASQAALDSLKIKAELRDGRLEIKRERPQGGRPQSGDASFKIYIPQTVRTIRADSVSGTIRLTDQDGRPERLEAVSQRLETISGSINTAGSKDLTMESVSGSLTFSSRGSRITINTISGSVRGKILEAPAGQKITMESVSGSLGLKLAEHWGGEVDLQSVSGSMTVRQPLSVREQSRGRLRGQIGGGAGGSAIIRGETISGDLTIE